MKKNKGITITSLIIYVIGLLILTGTMAMLTKYFYNNLGEITIENKISEEYAEFINYLTKDVNSETIKSIFEGEENKSILFKFEDEMTHKYIFSNGSIYFFEIKDGSTQKQIRLCTEVKKCTFTYQENILDISIEFNDGTIYNKSYKMKGW